MVGEALTGKRGARQAPQQEEEEVVTATLGISNKYGEQVTVSAPVCSVCHQRINMISGYVLTRNMNVCTHCAKRIEGKPKRLGNRSRP